MPTTWDAELEAYKGLYERQVSADEEADNEVRYRRSAATFGSLPYGGQRKKSMRL